MRFTYKKFFKNILRDALYARIIHGKHVLLYYIKFRRIEGDVYHEEKEMGAVDGWGVLVGAAGKLFLADGGRQGTGGNGFGGGDSVHAGNITREDIRELYHGHQLSGGGCGGKIAVRRHAVRTGELFSVYDTGR